MQLSYVPIANLALGHIGEDDRISAPDEDSRPARAVARAWELTRLFVLAEAHWSFAVRTVELVARADLPDWYIAGARYAFPLPADLVTLIELVEPCCLHDPDSYSIEGGPYGTEVLCLERGPLVLRYVRDGADIADPARWTPAFAAAFAFRLAWQISDTLAADKARKDRAFKNYQAELSLARRTNARMKAPIGHEETAWSRGRHVDVRVGGCGSGGSMLDRRPQDFAGSGRTDQGGEDTGAIDGGISGGGGGGGGGGGTPTPGSVENIYLENTEWAGGTFSSGRIDLASTLHPRTGTKHIHAALLVNGDFCQFTRSTPLPLGDYSAISFYIQNLDPHWGTGALAVTPVDNVGVPIGTFQRVRDRTYGFNEAITAAYQHIVIPLSAFATLRTIAREQIRTLRFSWIGGGLPSFNIDDVTLIDAVPSE